jgi:enterochelin esterase-like enzyme
MKKIIFLFSIFTSGVLHGQIDTTIYPVKTNLYQTNTIKGSLKTLEWKSEAMQEMRKITIYEPFGFHKDSTYNVVIVTDNQCEALAYVLEKKMINKKMYPILIVGIHNREPQEVDTIFGSNKVDFRTSEMLGYKFLSSNEVDFSNPNIVMNLSNRMISFRKFIVNEISNYLIDHYNVNDRSNWTLGGFSNGGAFAVDVTTTFPESFGYVIAMSPAGGVMNKGYDFDYSKTKSKYFICAGVDEKGFHKNSIELAKNLLKNNIEFEHKSFKSGHEYNMWLTYYAECLSKIYKI